MDLREFKKGSPQGQSNGASSKGTSSKGAAQGNAKVNPTQEQIRTAQDMAKIAQQYQNKSTEEVMSELQKLAKQGRQDGSLTNEKLKSLQAALTPMLNAEQQKKLRDLLGKI